MKIFKGGTLPRKWWMGAVSLAMACCLVLTAFPAAGPADAEPVVITEDTNEGGTPQVVSAYVFDSGSSVKLRDEDAAYINQMNYSFALIRDGKVSGSHWKAIKTFQKYISKHPNILPVVAVGGWGADGFSQAASTEKNRETFVKSAIELMDEYGFLGIDIDWEYPGSSAAGIKSSNDDPENLILLLIDLRVALDAKTAEDGKRRLLSIAVGGGKQYADALDSLLIGTLVDQVNVMTYDMQGFAKVTGHHTALYPREDEGSAGAAAAMDAFSQAGIPREKLMMGAAFYGRAWRKVLSDENDGLGQVAGTTGNKTYGYSAILGLLDKGSYTRNWDDEAMAPYLFNGSTFISYEDPESITAKGEFARETGLMGVMFWEYGLDKTGTLVKTLYSAMNGV